MLCSLVPRRVPGYEAKYYDKVHILQVVIRTRWLNLHTRVYLHAEHSCKWLRKLSNQLHQWCSLTRFHVNTAAWVTYACISIVPKFIARCYVVTIRYTRYCICDTDPPCRAYVHIVFTIIQFLRARANTYIQFLRAKNIYLLYPRKQWTRTIISYWPIPHFVCSIEALIPWALLSGFVHTNLGNWSTTITYCNSM